MRSLQAGDWSRADASRGRELGGAEAGARAGLQQSLAHTVATQLAQVTSAARTKVRAVDREKVWAVPPSFGSRPSWCSGC